MKRGRITTTAIYSLLPGLILFLSGCTKMSEKETLKSAGLNGGFEVLQNGLPVNWYMYTPNTVPAGDFRIVMDRDLYKEGAQSLKFDVRSCSSTGGWHSPGFTNEFREVGPYEGEATYRISFWIMNEGAKFNLSGGGVAPYKGEMRTLVESNKVIKDWELYEFEVDVPEERHLRFQLNILKPGIFWIDDIKIEKV